MGVFWGIKVSNNFLSFTKYAFVKSILRLSVLFTKIKIQNASFFDLNIYLKLITIIIELNFLSKFSC